MKPNEIKAARVRLGFTQEEMAEELNITVPSYRNRERGRVPFSDSEKISLMIKLQLSYQQFNDFLFDGQLPDIPNEAV